MTQAYPLQWPDHIPRSTKRETGQFKTAVGCDVVLTVTKPEEPR